MTQLPAFQYIRNAARTEGQMKDALDDAGLRDVIAELLGGEAVESLTIDVTGDVTPTRAVCQIDTYAAGSTDTLVNIVITNHPTGRFVLIRSVDPARVITVETGGAGNIDLFSNFVLDANTKWLLLIQRSGRWTEVLRFFGNDDTAMKAFWGFGDAADEDVGPGNGLDADTVDTLHAADFYQVGNQVDDADTLDTIHAAGFMQLAETGGQAVAGPITVDGGAITIDDTGSTPLLNFEAIGSLRGQIFWEDSNHDLSLRTYDALGVDTAADKRILAIEHGAGVSPQGRLKFWTGAAFVVIVDENGLIQADEAVDAEKLDGNLPSAVPFKASNYIAGTPGVAEVHSSIPADGNVNIQLNRFSAFPSFETTTSGRTWVRIVPYGITTPHDDPTVPKCALHNEHQSSSFNYYVSWEYPS